MAISLALHVVAAAIWIGGMFFAYVCLRPVLADADPAARLQTWSAVLSKFFPWVSMCIAVLFITGFLMIYAFGGFSNVGNYVYAMLAGAIVMTAIFKFILVAPMRHLKSSVAEGNHKVAAFALGTIRKLVLTNLIIGVGVILMATAFKSWF